MIMPPCIASTTRTLSAVIAFALAAGSAQAQLVINPATNCAAGTMQMRPLRTRSPLPRGSCSPSSSLAQGRPPCGGSLVWAQVQMLGRSVREDA